MTDQIPDEVRFEGTWFEVTAVDGTDLFDPAAHDLDPQALHTACWRGYICRYAIVDQRLLLQELRLGSEGEPPPLSGAQPRWNARHHEWHYEGVDMPVPFTGRLLIGHGTIPDPPYLNMGFSPAWMYTEVRELTLQAGTLLSATDHSAALAAQRHDLAATAAGPAAGEPPLDWIPRTFSLTYDYSWPNRPEPTPER